MGGGERREENRRGREECKRGGEEGERNLRTEEQVAIMVSHSKARKMHDKTTASHNEAELVSALTLEIRSARFAHGVVRAKQTSCAPTGRPAHAIFAFVPQFILSQPQSQFQRFVLFSVQRDFHQVVVHRILEEFGDLAH